MNAQEKQNKRFLSISRVAKFVTIVATCSFKITELFSFMKAKKSSSDFIKFLLFWSALKTFEIMHQSIPAVPITPPGNHGAFAQMSVPGVGH